MRQLEIKMKKTQIFRNLAAYSDNQGFTLIEVLMAMVIFAIGILSVAAMQTNATPQNTRHKASLLVLRFFGPLNFARHSALISVSLILDLYVDRLQILSESQNHGLPLH